MNILYNAVMLLCIWILIVFILCHHLILSLFFSVAFHGPDQVQAHWKVHHLTHHWCMSNILIPKIMYIVLCHQDYCILVRIRLISGASLSDWYRKWICVNGILKCSCSVVMGMVACLASCFFCLIWQFERTYNSFRYLHLEIWRFSCWRQTDKPALPLARMRAG